jgi:archaeosine synthase
VTSRYHNRFDQPLVLVPCSAEKPYSESKSHGRFHEAIDFRGHTVSMTSPIGVVPQELELTYPAQHYDSVVTGHWSETEIEFVASVLESYLRRCDYDRHVAHLPDDYREITDRVAERLGIEFEYTVADHPTDADSLANLAGALEGEQRYRKSERQHNTLKAIADYQFGERAGDELFHDLSVESHYPKLRANDGDGEQLAAMVPQYGTLSLTIAGARRWIDSDVPEKRAEIDAFVPRGSVLAPGVVDADDDIRVGDEVVFEGPKALAVGRAEMSGPEMAESTRGIASEVRHTVEK